MPALMNSICYKQPKPITHYSSSFNEFVTKMLQKKKEDRPLITYLIESFADYPCQKIAVLSPLDQANYWSYKKRSQLKFDKKRTVEKNMGTYKKDFSELKKRVL